MNQTDASRLPTMADLLPAEQARELVARLGVVLGRALGREVEIRDEHGDLLGILRPVPKALPNGEVDPLFLEELRRRSESPEPPVPVERVLAYLDAVARGEDVSPG
jgi:hypothetical protein